MIPERVPPTPLELATSALGGNRRSLARLISNVESRVPGADAALASLVPRRRHGPGAPRVIGITGPPGAGKSTLTDQLLASARAVGLRVGVVAVDPSSPISGGAILGDRVRLDRHALDLGVYIRSLSARGHTGGLSRAAAQIVDVLDAVGFDMVIVETVGVGQGELGVMEVADTVMVVLTPESGDGVQAMKAGLLEIADVFVVNKADRPGAEALVRELELAVHLDTRPGWKAPVHTSNAVSGRGVEEVVATLAGHDAWLRAEGRGAWETRRADGRVRTWLDLVAADARDAAQVLYAAELIALRAGTQAPETMPRPRQVHA
ncbi:MAG: methylmalonyl Co-A mutase-associated GTPase MeaB [Myxococcales bacterium]|nr:methylmalonyl Co-A mutase-associated GTPase MeaB [Myxococcales bacterium]